MRSLRSKLLVSYAILVVGILAVGAWSVYNFAVLGRSVRRIMANNYRSVLDAQVMKETLERQDSALLFHLAGHREKAGEQYRGNRDRFLHYYRDAAANITELGEDQVIADLGAHFGRYRRNCEAFLELPASPAARDRYFAVLEPAFLALKNRADDLLSLNQAAMLRAQRRAEGQAGAATRAAVALALTTAALGIFYSLNLSRRLVAPIVALTDAARGIGAGDLDTRIKIRTGDEVEVLGDEFGRMAGALKDYREREAARLQVAEQQAEAAIDSLYEPVLVTDAAGRLTSLNRAAEALFLRETVADQEPVEALEAPAVARAVREALERRAAVAPESERGVLIRTVHGAERIYRVRTAPLLRDAEHAAGTVTVLEDITRQRQVDLLKDEFISVASHELRTPLTSLQMAVQLLAEGSSGPLTEAQGRLVRMAEADAERLERLTRDLLDLTRLEAGTAVPNRRSVSAANLVELGVRAVTTQAEQKGVTLEVGSVQGEVSADPEQIGRVLTNLATNAVRHTPPGGRVLFSARPEEGRVQFEVADTGPGIPADYVHRIFDRFVQVPGATSGGAGLGLPIARKIVEAHGGEIWAESPPGAGASFRFTLPEADAAGVERRQDGSHPDHR